MSFINKNLMEGEHVVCEAKFHYMLYWLPILLVIVALALPFIPIGDDTLKYRLIFTGIFLLLAALWAIVINNGKRFILTNKRIILKTGIIQRNSNELMLRKCEGIKVTQSIMGRLLNYGNVAVTTGEVVDVFKYIYNPMAFSTKVNEQIDKISTASVATAEPKQSTELSQVKE
ncbi:MAG: PH domain-containing protein [Prevotella sp.]|jgi:uncharacterized membrane protein YdbT with pleckstrin-like domain|nr:PH domain-containing protein [Prevotella sp.]